MKRPALLFLLSVWLALPAMAQQNPRPCTAIQPVVRTLLDTSYVRPGTVWDTLVQIKKWSDSTRTTCLARHVGVVPPSPPPSPVPPPTPPPSPPSAGSDAEPADPGSGYVWRDDFNRYPTVLSTGACDANQVFGPHTQYNTGQCGQMGSQYAFTPGRTGNALRGLIPLGSSSVTWLTPWPPGFSYQGRGLVVQFWFRGSVGGTPGPNGMKWLEAWDASSNRVQWGMDGSGPRWAGVLGSNPGGTVNRTQSSASWTSYNDGQWHRATHLFVANSSTTYRNTGGTSSTTETYTGSSSRDGRIAMWVDGVLVLDYQQSKVGRSCTQGDVDFLPTYRLSYLKLIDVVNGSSTAFTLDVDDLKLWTP